MGESEPKVGGAGVSVGVTVSIRVSNDTESLVPLYVLSKEQEVLEFCIVPLFN